MSEMIAALPEGSPGPAVRPVTQRRRGLGILGLLGLAVLLAAIAVVALGLLNLPVTVSIDGEPLWHGSELAALDPLEKLVLAIGLLVAVATLLVVVPTAVLIGVVLAVAGLTLALAVPVVLLAVVAAVLLSPLWLLGWLVWRSLR